MSSLYALRSPESILSGSLQACPFAHALHLALKKVVQLSLIHGVSVALIFGF